MPIRRSTLKSASAALILLPLLSFSQNPLSSQAGSTGGDKPGSKPAVTKDTKTPPPAAVNGGKAGPPADLGDAWDSLKLDSKMRVKLSFRNANVDNIVAFVMKASHTTIIKDPSLTGAMTVATADYVSLQEAFHVFNTVLKMKGFELSRDKKLLIIAPIKKPAPPAPPAQPPQQPPPQPPPDANPVVKFYPIMYASAQQVARAINDVFAPSMPQPGQPFPQQMQPGGRPGGGGGSNVRASYEEFSNSVIVHATAAEQIEVAELIKQIDKTQTLPEHSKTYQLEYAVATEVVSSVQNVLEANLTKGRGAKDNSNNFSFFFFGFDNNNQNLAVADARTNSLIVTGTDELLKVADRIIADLDHPTPVVSTTFVFPLQNARADTVANLLTAAFGPRSGSQNNSNSKTTITPSNNQFNNTPPGTGNRPGGAGANIGKPDDQNLAVNLQDPNASSGDLLTSVGVTQGFFFDGGGGGFGQGRRGNNGQTVGHGRNGKVTNIHDLTGQVTAVADANTNSIIIVTSPDNADLVKDIIDQLDKIPEQVMIQTIVVEATLDRSKQFGLEWSFAHKVGNNSSPTGTATQGFGIQGQNPPPQGFSYALTGGDLTSFFNMLQTDTKFQVLSTPRIFTSNNMEAQINISQSIPYVTSTFQNITGTNSYNYAFQDVGIVLTVTPHITSNGYVTMDVLQTANDLQGYTTFNAPIVNQREAETTVSAKDGETIVLGGMIRDQITSTVNKIPLLGDIPFLGNIFRNTSMGHQKTELLVFLTPRVIRDPAEAKKLQQENEKALSKSLQGMIKENMQTTKTGAGKG